MAAGLGFKTFTTGEVLTAADTNGYLMQGVLVFASAAARDAAITSPQEGQCCYLKDTDAVLTYSGAAWVGFDDSNAIQNAIVDAKGDLIAASAADTPARLAVGTNNFFLQAASGESTGLKWGGTWTSYTPTWTGTTTNPAIGNGTLEGSYIQIGNFIHFYIAIIMGSTTTYGSGQYRFGLPVATTDGKFNLGYDCVLLDDGVSWYYGYHGAGVAYGSVSNFEISSRPNTQIGNLVPFTFAVNDRIYVSGSYRVA